MDAPQTYDLTLDLNEVLGYVNFSSGQPTPRFYAALDRLYAEQFAADTASNVSAIRQMLSRLLTQLVSLSQTSDAFRDTQRGQCAITFVRDHFIDAYRDFHRDLLFGQSDDQLFNAFLIARVFETWLASETPSAETTDLTAFATEMVTSVNDLLGYRPVPVLEGKERHQPNDHEWVAAIPLYKQGVGVASGKYKEIVESALALLAAVSEDIIRESGLDMAHLREIVLDPRPYDFDHPVNRRPNYHFGYWDPHAIDNQGNYERYVIHEVLLDCAMMRVETTEMGDAPVSNVQRDELLYEAGSVLLGTMLMGSGVTGGSPHSHDSTISLQSLMPIIAAYRDRFYTSLLQQAPPKMQPRLTREADTLFQPFGGARQDLNRRMAKRRADQLQRLHLARTYARMGYFNAAHAQTAIIAVVSARLYCQMDCLITEAHFLADRDAYHQAASLLPIIEDTLRRAIACGAIVDPWTILGFGAQFSLFATAENSIHDHRVDDLLNIADDIFDLYSRLLKSAAAAGDDDLQADLSDQMSDLAGWWDQFGVTEVSNIEGFSGQAAWESAAKVATALAVWHKAGTAAGDIAFWSRHVERLQSPKAFVLLAEALLDRDDLIATMALMMHWLSHSETIPLTEANYSFHTISLRWMEQLWRPEPDAREEERWRLTEKFFDYLEANADLYGQVPDIEIDDALFAPPEAGTARGKPKKGGSAAKRKPKRGDDADDTTDHDTTDHNAKHAVYDESAADGWGDGEPISHVGSDPTYSAAYEGMTYHDSADDGIDDAMMDVPGPVGRGDDEDFALSHETERISDRLAFLTTVSKCWRFAAVRSPVLVKIVRENEHRAAQKKSRVSHAASVAPVPASPDAVSDHDRVREWLRQGMAYWHGLTELLDKASRYQVPLPRGTADSLSEYDRHRGTKEILLDRIIWVLVEIADAILLLQAVLGEPSVRLTEKNWESPVCKVLASILRRDAAGTRAVWSGMLKALSAESLLYIPTARGGAASAIVACRVLQQVILRLFEFAPRLGLLRETFPLLELIEEMERIFPARTGAITEYDRLVETATRAVAVCVAESSKSWSPKRGRGADSVAESLVHAMEQLVELVLEAWLSHSRQIRISPLESVHDREVWDTLKEFIQHYGSDIFTQQFMAFSNLRAVLHEGVETYLKQLMRLREEEDETSEIAEKLLADLAADKIDWEIAVTSLELIFESIAENYTEYIDYNSTTTHSDHGEKLYMLMDMLRVQAGYERISWNLKPVYWIHDALIRAGCHDAAVLWEHAVATRSVTAADEHLRRYQRLSTKYGLWIPSIHERLQERFIRPIQIDRMCGLVLDAVREAKKPEAEQTTFRELSAQVDIFAKSPSGVGYEVPEWLSALQDEAMATRIDAKTGEDQSRLFDIVPPFAQVHLTKAQLEAMIKVLTNRD